MYFAVTQACTAVLGRDCSIVNWQVSLVHSVVRGNVWKILTVRNLKGMSLSGEITNYASTKRELNTKKVTVCTVDFDSFITESRTVDTKH